MIHNPEKRLEYMRKRNPANPEKRLVYRRKWNAANRKKNTESTSKWKAANPEKVREQKRRRRGRELANGLNAAIQALEDFHNQEPQRT